MTDLECTKCGIEASYADANIADLRGTCGSDDQPAVIETAGGYEKYTYGGDTHDWAEV